MLRMHTSIDALMFFPKQIKLHNQMLRVYLTPRLANHAGTPHNRASWLSCYHTPSTVLCVNHAPNVHMQGQHSRDTSQGATDVVHCGALPNRSAATRYDFENTPRPSLHIYVGKTQKTRTRSMLRGRAPLRFRTICFHGLVLL